MALFFPVGSTASVLGKYGGDSLQQWRTRIVQRKATKPANRRTTKQSTTRRLTGRLSKKWADLTSPQQTCWDIYGTCIGISKTGFYAFQSDNHKLLYADHINLILHEDSPVGSNIPDAPTELTLTYSAGADDWSLGWTTPDDEDLYVQFWAWKQATYTDKYGAYYVYQGTTQSDNLSLAISASGYQAGTILQGKARTISLVGETSIWTNNIEATKT